MSVSAPPFAFSVKALVSLSFWNTIVAQDHSRKKAKMFSSISIRNFRCFKDLSINSLDRVNIIAGSNDVGKTALLEAIYLLLGEGSPELALRINAFRGLEKVQADPNTIAEWIWPPLFYNFLTDGVISIRGRFDGLTDRNLKIRVVNTQEARVPLGLPTSQPIPEVAANGFSTKALQLEFTDGSGKSHISNMIADQQGIRIEPLAPPPKVPGHIILPRTRVTPEEDAKYFGRFEMSEQPYDLLKVLQIIEPRLTKVSTILGGGGVMLFGDIGINRMMPLPLMGDGLGRFTTIILRIAVSRGGVVLIDEIENGLHYAVLEKVWRAIAEATRLFNVQVVTTTHSWECIKAAHRAFESTENYNMRLHRLNRRDDSIHAVTYDQEMLATAIKTDLEVR
jgi:hypothetical protein